MSPEDLHRLPLAVFPGKVHLVEGEASAFKARLILARTRRVGLDTESRPSFRKGEFHPISLIQIATERHAFLYQVQPGRPYRALRSLIENPRITKVVQGAPEEIRELRRDLGIAARGFVDLPTVAREAGFKTLNLRGLAAEVLGVRISKGAQRSDWSRRNLSPKQIEYAATDAWAALAVYDRIHQGRLASLEPVASTASPAARTAGGREPPTAVHPARPADAEAVARLIRELAATIGESSRVNSSRVRRWLQTPGCGALVAVETGAVVGTRTYTVRPNLYHALPVFLIEELVVHAGSRGKGLGRALLDTAIKIARGKGCAEISVSTESGNTSAQTLYRSAGLTDESVLLERHLRA
jgi:GNAT superfamily N-acetyltransferase